jgi:hypothetical protein
MLETKTFIETLLEKLKKKPFVHWIDLVEFYKYLTTWNYPTFTNAIIN